MNGFRTILALMVAAAALAGACGGSSSGTPAGSAPSVARSVDPNFDTGQTVEITDSAVRPVWLVSQVGKPIVFRNLTGRTVRVVFDHQPVRSGPIAPGSLFRYTPKVPISMTYHAGRRAGKVQVSPVLGGSP